MLSRLAAVTAARFITGCSASPNTCDVRKVTDQLDAISTVLALIIHALRVYDLGSGAKTLVHSPCSWGQGQVLSSQRCSTTQ